LPSCRLVGCVAFACHASAGVAHNGLFARPSSSPAAWLANLRWHKFAPIKHTLGTGRTHTRTQTRTRTRLKLVSRLCRGVRFAPGPSSRPDFPPGLAAVGRFGEPPLPSRFTNDSRRPLPRSAIDKWWACGAPASACVLSWVLLANCCCCRCGRAAHGR
jgi:hypothetical protein